MYAEFPEKLRYDPDDLADVNIPSNIIFVRILCGVDHLQNLFLVERLLLLHGQLDEGDLIITSFALVSLALNVWTHKDRFMSSLRTFDWLVRRMAYSSSFLSLLTGFTPIVDCIWCFCGRHSMPRAASPNFCRHSSQGRKAYPLEHRAATKLARWILQLGPADGPERGPLRRLRRLYPARAGLPPQFRV